MAPGSPKRASTAAAASRCPGSAGSASTVERADLGLQRLGRALGDDAAAVDDRHPVGEHVGLLEVLRGEEHRDAVVGGQAPDLLPQRAAALRVQARGRLVEEQHGRVVDERQREVEPALHAARVAADLAVGRLGEARRARAARPRAHGGRPWRRPCSPPWRSKCSRPVRNASSAASCSAAPMRLRTAGPWVATSSPATRALPAVGGSSVVSMCTVVDLPAPLGPRKP